MALLDNVSFKTNLVAGAFTQMVRNKSAFIGNELMPILAVLMGKSEYKDDRTLFDVKSNVIRTISGESQSFNWRLPRNSFAAVTNPADARTISSTPIYGGTKYDLTFINDTIGMSKFDLDKITGPERKMNESLADAYIASATTNMFQYINTAWHGTGDQTSSTIGSWQRAIDVDDTIGTYLGIQRAASGNDLLRGVVKSAPLSLGNLRSLILDVHANKGRPDLMLMNKAEYAVLQDEISDGYFAYQRSGMWESFGAPFFEVDGIKAVLDPDCPAGKFPLLTTSTWNITFGNNGPMVGEFKRSETTKAQMWAPFDCYVGITTVMPKHNAKFIVTEPEE